MLKLCTCLVAVLSASSQLYAFTWSAPVAINAGAATDATHETTPKLAVGPDGNISAAWISEARTGTSTITVTRRWNVETANSANAGTRWQGEKTLSDPAFSNGDIDLAAGDAGQFYLAWNSGDIFSEFRFHTATTFDGGSSFTTQTATNPFTPQETGFFGPQLAKSGPNLILARSSYNLSNPNTHPLYSRYYLNSLGSWSETGTATTSESLVTNGELASDGAENLVAAHWQSINDSVSNFYRIIISTSNNSGTSWTSRGPVSAPDFRAFDPDVAAGGNGVWVLTYVYNPVEGPSFRKLAIQRSTDNGATWSPPAYLTAPANMADTYRTPSVTSNRAGEWIIVLSAEKQIAPTGTYGTDGDILYTRSIDNGLTWSAMEPVLPDADTDVAIDATPEAEWLGNGKWGLAWSRNETTPTSEGDIVWSTGNEPVATVDSWGLYED